MCHFSIEYNVIHWQYLQKNMIKQSPVSDKNAAELMIEAHKKKTSSSQVFDTG
jgi:hypothetical protein